MKTKLHQFNKDIRALLASFLIVLSIGVGIGLYYIYYTTAMGAEGTELRYAGEIPPNNYDPEIDFSEKPAKETEELLSLTHNHIITFAFIFLLTALIFEKNTVINGRWKLFLIIEPFISTIITFSGFFIIQYFRGFSYIIIISSTLMYLSFYVMALVSIYQLIFMKNERK